MKFPFDETTLCKVIARQCNDPGFGKARCPAGDPLYCPFIDLCRDITWKDWREFFRQEPKYGEKVSYLSEHNG